MSENNLDPRYEKLVALLYGELSAEDERDVRRMIDEDAELRAEWEEISAARDLLSEWEIPETSPSFVFLDEEKPAESESSGYLARLRARFGSFATATPWAVAAAAVVIAVLALADFQVDTSGGALAFRFGSPGESGEPAPALVDSEAGVPLSDRHVSPVSQLQNLPLEDRLLIPGASPFLTRQEFENYQVNVTQTIIALLNDYSRTRDQEMSGILQNAFAGVTNRQAEEYNELRSRIETVGLGLAEQQYKSEVQFDYLMQQDRSGLVSPASSTPEQGPEGVER